MVIIRSKVSDGNLPAVPDPHLSENNLGSIEETIYCPPIGQLASVMISD